MSRNRNITNLFLTLFFLVALLCLGLFVYSEYKEKDRPNNSSVIETRQDKRRPTVRTENSRELRHASLATSGAFTIDEVKELLGSRRTPEQIIRYFKGHQDHDEAPSVIYSVLRRRLKSFSNQQLFELYKACPSSLMVMTISKHIPQKAKTIPELANLLEEYHKQEASMGGKAKRLFERIAKELGKESTLVRTGEGVSEVVNLLGNQNKTALSYFASEIVGQLNSGEIKDKDRFYEEVFTVVQNETVLNKIIGVYIKDQLNDNTPYQDLGAWVLEQDSQISRYGSEQLIRLAYEKQDLDWAVDYVNDFISKSKSEKDSRAVVSTLADLKVKGNPRDAMKWGMAFPDDTPGKHTVLVKAFSALNQKDRNASLAMIKLVRSEETRKSLLAIDRHFEDRRALSEKE